MDRAVSRNCNTRKTNLKSFKLSKINRTQTAFIKNPMELWKTNLEANSRPIGQVTIRCDTCQGDAPPPLLFCIGLNPLSQIITSSGFRYLFRNGAISHLLDMDDIKLYAKREQDISSLTHINRIYSTDVNMSFWLNKCCRMISKKDKMITTEGVELPESNIADVHDNYCYRGIPQVYIANNGNQV